MLTAHPTEVQRKSILDAEREIARLLEWRDRDDARAGRGGARVEAALHRQVLALWQTAMLRLAKLEVKDEIDNGLAYYRYTFLEQIPRLYAALGAHAAARAFGVRRMRGCRRSCAWARGSAATATATRSSTPPMLDYAVRAQATVAFAHYLGEVHALGGELSLSTRLVQPTPALLALAAAARRRQPAPRRTSRTARR